jgi:hypothetical protein
MTRIAANNLLNTNVTNFFNFCSPPLHGKLQISPAILL